MSFKFGIIGAGIMGQAGGNILNKIDDVEISAIADISEKTLQRAASELKVSAIYNNYQDMLQKERLNAVYVATPDQYHKEPVIDSLNAGCHVLVEKPMTTRQEDAEDIVKAVNRTGKKLMVNFNHRWLAPYYKIRDMIDTGQLGEPIIAYARKNNPIRVPTNLLASWAKDSSPAWFMNSHDIDLIVWWFNAEPVEVYSKGIKRVLKSRGMDTYDGIQSLVTFKSGQFATFEAVWIYPDTSPYMPDSFMEIVGTKGTVHIDRKTEAISAILQEEFSCPRTFLNYKVYDEWVGALPNSMRAFVNACKYDKDTIINAREGLRSTAILDGIHRSLKSGKPEHIKIAV